MPTKKPSGKAMVKSPAIGPRIAVFAVVAICVAAYFIGTIKDVELSEVAPYFLVAMGIQFLPFLLRADPDPFEPASLAGAMNLLALVPAFTSYVVQDTVTLTLLPQISGRSRVELVQTVMVAYVVGSLSYFAGYYQGVGRKFARFMPDVAGGEWRRPRFLIVVVGCLGLFIPAYAYFQSRVGVGITDITQLGAGKAVWHDDTTKSWLIRAVGIGFIPPLLFVSLNFPRIRTRRAIATAAALLLVGFLATRLGGRGTAVFCTINALIVIHYLGRRIPISILAAIAFGMIVVTNVLGSYRADPNQTVASAPGPTPNFNAAEALAEHDDDRVRIAAMAVLFHHFPERKDYLMGESWGPVLTVFIPRWLWPEKNLMFLWRDSNIVREITGAPVPVPYLGLLYANFSWVGIVLGMALWGAFQRGMYEWLQKSNKDKNVVLLYSCMIIYVAPTMLQLSATIGYVLPMWVAIRFMRRKPKPVKNALPAKPGPTAPVPATAPAPETPLLPAAAE